MRFIFATASKPHPNSYPFSAKVALPKNYKRYKIGDTGFDTPEGWLEGIRNKLLTLGIVDVECLSIEQGEENSAKFQFFFKNMIELRQFQALACNNNQGEYPLTINSMTTEISHQRQKAVSHFCELHGIKHHIFLIDEFSFEIVTDRFHSFLAIAIQIEKGTFDTGIPIPSPTRKILALEAPKPERA